MDLVKTKAARAKTVFLPGFGQVVCDPKSKDKAKSAPEVPGEHIDRLVEEGAIEPPKGYKTPAERDAAEKSLAAEAAASGASDPKVVEVKSFELGGYVLAEQGGGWFIISNADGEVDKVQGEDNAKAKLLELLRGPATGDGDGASQTQSQSAPA